MTETNGRVIFRTSSAGSHDVIFGDLGIWGIDRVGRGRAKAARANSDCTLGYNPFRPKNDSVAKTSFGIENPTLNSEQEIGNDDLPRYYCISEGSPAAAATAWEGKQSWIIEKVLRRYRYQYMVPHNNNNVR